MMAAAAVTKPALGGGISKGGGRGKIPGEKKTEMQFGKHETARNRTKPAIYSPTLLHLKWEWKRSKRPPLLRFAPGGT